MAPSPRGQAYRRSGVRWLLCHRLHADFRFNMRKWLARYLRQKIEGVDLLAKRLAIRAAVGLHPSDKELEEEAIPALSFLTTFTYKLFPFYPLSVSDSAEDSR